MLFRKASPSAIVGPVGGVMRAKYLIGRVIRHPQSGRRPCAVSAFADISAGFNLLRSPTGVQSLDGQHAKRPAGNGDCVAVGLMGLSQAK
jgi:hypothetical protein